MSSEEKNLNQASEASELSQENQVSEVSENSQVEEAPKESKAKEELHIFEEKVKENIHEINKENNELEEEIIKKLGPGAEVISKSQPKNKWISLILCVLVGVSGIHKFYEGRIVWGFVYLFTAGLFVVGVIVDIIVILNKPNPYFVDKNSFF